VVVAVDPSGTKGGGAGDDVGIVAAGKGRDGRFYVLEDASCNLSPDAWARTVAATYEKWHADRVVAEMNFGGAMVEAVLRTAARHLPIKLVTASRGKVIRAEPIAALYEQGKVSHCGQFAALEDQLCSMTGGGYVGEGSPDRADALVWALTELSIYKPSLLDCL
jgi:predicted phage terminase large subunit-like protein